MTGKLRIINAVLCILRVYMVILSPSGYIHPDEYFQSSEIVASDILQLQATRTWEWESSFPVRNIFFPYVAAGLPFWMLKAAKTFFDFHISTYMLLLLPRCVMLMFMHTMEIIVLRMMNLEKIRKCRQSLFLLLFRTSHVAMIFLTRLFSNSCETFLFTLLLYLVLKRLKIQTQESFNFIDLQIGLVLSIGFFVRASFLIFSFYPILHVVLMMLIKLPLFKMLRNGFKTVFVMLNGFLLGFIVNVVLDSFYFSNKLKLSLHITPLNLIRYNTDPGSLKNHGIHPRYLHIVVNMLLMYGPLYVAFLVIFFMWIHASIRNHVRNRETNNVETHLFMTFSTIIPVLLLSFIPHQEPRFLLPVIIPMICLIVSCMKKNFYAVFLLSWLVFNFIGILWYGFLHQAGVIPMISFLNQQLNQESKNITHYVLFWQTYMPPKHLFGVSKKRNDVIISDFCGSSFSNVMQNISHVTSADKNHGVNQSTKILWFVLPSAYQHDVFKYSTLKWKIRKKIYPHVSAENIPVEEMKKFIHKFSFSTTTAEVLTFLRESFSLNLLVVNT